MVVLYQTLAPSRGGKGEELGRLHGGSLPNTGTEQRLEGRGARPTTWWFFTKHWHRAEAGRARS